MEVTSEQAHRGRSGPRDRLDRAPLTTIGALLLAAVVGADVMVSNRSLAAELPPPLGPGDLLRSAVLAIAATALVIGLRRRSVARFEPRARTPAPGPIERWAIVAGAVPAVASAALILASPDTLSSLVREDGPIEWASAGLAFLAGLLYLVAAAIHAGRATTRSTLLLLAIVAAAGAALLLGLEEISWFQRVLDVESPEFMLNRNGQQELNLHNLATGATGNAYFVGGFLWCTALPHLLDDRRLPAPLTSLQPLLPSRTVLLATATSTAIVYEMWNIVWIQMTFWSTLAILATVGPDDTTRRTGRALLAVSVVVVAGHLLAGDAMIRSWDDTEVRELVIPYGLALAAGQTVVRIDRATRAT